MISRNEVSALIGSKVVKPKAKQKKVFFEVDHPRGKGGKFASKQKSKGGAKVKSKKKAAAGRKGGKSRPSLKKGNKKKG